MIVTTEGKVQRILHLDGKFVLNGSKRPAAEIKLSILIPSLRERQSQLAQLIAFLIKQANTYSLQRIVELVVLVDKGQWTVGRKRNELLQAAVGAYTAFVDDDDWLSDTYVRDVIKATQADVDVIGFVGEMTSNGRNPKKFVHALHNPWKDQPNVYVRPPNHLNPIRSKISKDYKFPHISCGEDKDWSDQVNKSGRLKSEVFLGGEILYYYRFSPSSTRAQVK